MVTIKMPDNYWKSLSFALDVAEDFYSLRFADGFEKLFANAFTENNEVSCAERHSNEILATLFDRGLDGVSGTEATVAVIQKLKAEFAKGDGEYDLTDNEMGIVAEHLDFVIRIWLGQWGELQKVVSRCHYANGDSIDDYYFMEDTKERAIIAHRHEMLPVFAINRIMSPNSSFGIYSGLLNDDVRILYGLYKSIRFSLSGLSHDDEIVRNSDKPVIIQYPYVDEVVVENNEQAMKWLDKHPTPSFSGSAQSYILDGDKVYVYIRDNLSIEIAPGTKIYANKNGRLDVERDGNLYNYRHKVTF